MKQRDRHRQRWCSALALWALAAAGLAARAAFAAASTASVLGDPPLDVMAPGRSQTAVHPCIVPYRDGALLDFRLDTGTGVRHRAGRGVAIVQLDAAFAPLSVPQVLVLCPSGARWHTAEDPRLLWVAGAVYALLNKRLVSAQCDFCAMHLARLAQLLAPTGALEQGAGDRHRRVEKNCAPFARGADRGPVYLANPPVVLQVPRAALATTNKKPIAAPALVWGAPNFESPAGALRGGTPPIAVPTILRPMFAASFHVRRSLSGAAGDGVFYGMGDYFFAAAPPDAIEPIVPAVTAVPRLWVDRRAPSAAVLRVSGRCAAPWRSYRSRRWSPRPGGCTG